MKIPGFTNHVVAFGIGAFLLFPLTGYTNDVEANYKKRCASCHGKDGSGKTRMGKKSGARDYRDPKVQATVKPEEAFKNVKDGMKVDGKVKMKPFADKLTDDEIKALILHMKTFEKK